MYLAGPLPHFPTKSQHSSFKIGYKKKKSHKSIIITGPNLIPCHCKQNWCQLDEHAAKIPALSPATNRNLQKQTFEMNFAQLKILFSRQILISYNAAEIINKSCQETMGTAVEILG